MKTPFLTKEKALEISRQIPTPFHVYDEKGIRANAAAVKEAFAWNKGYREYFAVKATPNPYRYIARIWMRHRLLFVDRVDA